MKKLLLAAAAVISLLGPAQADYNITTPITAAPNTTLQTVRAGGGSGSPIINYQSPIDATGAAFGTVGNPFAFQFGTSVLLPAFAAPPTVNLGTLNGAATATLQTSILTALGSPLQAGGSVSISSGSISISGTLPNFASVQHFICDSGCSGGGGGGGAVFGPTAVGTAAANPPVLVGGTVDGTATGAVSVLKVLSGVGFINCANCSGSGISVAFGSAIGSVGTPGGFKDGSGNFQPLLGDVTNGQWVSIKSSVSLGVTGTFWQTTQPISAASLPLPTGAATSALQTTGNTSLASILTALGSPMQNSGGSVSISGTATISGSVTANAGTNLNTSALALETGGNLGTIATNTGRIPAQGQALAAGSTPVVLTALQLSTLTPPAAITNFAQETGGNLASIASKTPALGQALAAASVPVVLPTAQLSTLTPLSTVAVTQSTSPWIVAGGGTAGTPGTAVLAVQGVSGGTAVPISGSVSISGGGVGVSLNTSPSLTNGNGVVPTQGGSVLSATNGLYTNILQGNAALSATNPIFGSVTDGTNKAAVKAASTAPVATDPALVVGLSPNSAGIITYVDPCQNPGVLKSSVAINVSTATTTALVPVSGSTAVYVCGFSLVIAGSATTANSAKFEYGTGTACASGATALTGTFGSNDAAVSTTPTNVNMSGPGTLFTAPASNGLCLVTAGNAPFDQGVLTYVQQ